MRISGAPLGRVEPLPSSSITSQGKCEAFRMLTSTREGPATRDEIALIDPLRFAREKNAGGERSAHIME